MAEFTFAQVADCQDKALTVSTEDMEAANEQIALVLRARGIDPGVLTLPNTVLKTLAVHYALYLTATRNIAGEDSPLADKAKLYRQLYLDAVAGLSPAALALVSPPSVWGSITLGRS